MENFAKRPRGLTIEQVDGMRPTCLVCFRPEEHCLCRLVPRFRAQCNLLILQHPNERQKYYGTARMIAVAIENARIMRGLYFSESEIERTLAGRNPYILFPSDDAVDCESIEFSERDTVVVIDGTWSEAGKVLSRNRILRNIPRLTFRRALKSHFHIRKQPKMHYLSTLESIAHLLRLNAEANGLLEQVLHCNQLLAGFNQMVERQLTYFPRSSLASSS